MPNDANRRLPSETRQQTGGAQGTWYERPARSPDRRLPSEGREPQSAWSDVLKTIPSSLMRGINLVGGMGGDVQNLTELVGTYLGRKGVAAKKYVTGAAPTWDSATQLADREVATNLANRRVPRVPLFVTPTSMLGSLFPADSYMQRTFNPTSAQLNNAVNSALRLASGAATGHPVEMYRPQTAPGRVADTIVQTLPGAAVMGPGSFAKNLGSNLTGAVASGAALGTTHEVVDPNNPYKPALELGAATLGGLGGGTVSALRNMRNPELPTQLAGQVLREGYTDPAQARVALSEHVSNPRPIMAGVEPTTAQVVGTPEAYALERAVDNSSHMVPTSNAGAAANQRGNSAAILRSGQPIEAEGAAPVIPALVGDSIRKPDMERAFALPSNVENVQTEASRQLHRTLTQTERALKNRELQAWNELDQGATLNGTPILADLNRYVGELSIPNAKRFPSEVRAVLRDLTDNYGVENPELQLAAPPMPVGQLQDFRRIVGEDANRAYAMGKDTEGRNLRGFADLLGKHLEDADNYNFGSEGAAEAWRNAVDASRLYKQSFGSGITRDLTATDINGAPIVAPEAAMDRVLSGGTNAVNNIRQLRGVEGINTQGIDQSITDWQLGKLTGNGANYEVPASKLAATINDPKFSAIAGEVPALRNRSQAVLETALANDEANRLQKVVDDFHGMFDKGSPDKLHRYMTDNMDDLKAATSPEHHPFVDQLHNTADYWRTIGSGAPKSTDTLDKLTQGSLMSLVYGKAAGPLADAAAGSIPGMLVDSAIGAFTGVPGLGTAAGVVGGALSRKGGALDRLVGRAVFGGTQQEAMTLLNEAARNPRVALDLMGAGDPAVSWKNILANRMTDAGKGAVYASLRHPPAPPDDSGAPPANTSVFENDYPVPAAPPEDGVFGNDYDVPHPSEAPALPTAVPGGAPASGASVLDNDYAVPAQALPRAKREEAPVFGTAGGTSVLDNDYAVPDVERVGRASGGKVDNTIEPLVSALMGRAQSARLSQEKATEPLLKLHDNAIASALHAAQRAI